MCEVQALTLEMQSGCGAKGDELKKMLDTAGSCPCCFPWGLGGGGGTMSGLAGAAEGRFLVQE